MEAGGVASIQDSGCQVLQISLHQTAGGDCQDGEEDTAAQYHDHELKGRVWQYLTLVPVAFGKLYENFIAKLI